MKILFKQILTYTLLCITLNVYGQKYSINDSTLDWKRIDSLTAVIDKRDPSKTKLDNTTSLDSLIGEQIITIEKQTFKTLCKYTLKTKNSGLGMDVTFIELYLSNDSLIKASVFYDMPKKNFWKMFYFKDKAYFMILIFPRCMGYLLEENGQKYVSLVNKLMKIKSNK